MIELILYVVAWATPMIFYAGYACGKRNDRSKYCKYCGINT